MDSAFAVLLIVFAIFAVGFFMSHGELRRFFFAGIAMCIALPAIFLAIFVPGLLWDEHIAPHDGQGGIGWFFLAAPISMLAALIAGPASYALSVKWGWFEHGPEE